MDTQNLRTYILLSKVKNFTQTADQLFVAQSTVTNRIAELEKEVGKKLINRDRKNISLTDEGQLFLSYAERIVNLEELSIQEINSSVFFQNTIKIGSTNTIYDCHLNSTINSMLQKQSDVATKIIIGHSQDLIQMLQDGLLDIVFSYIPFKKAGYECNLFVTDELVLVTNNKNTEYSKGIRKDELVCLNFLFCNFALQEVGLFIRELFPTFYQFTFEIDNSSKLIPHLLSGLGYSFLPKSLVNSYLENGTFISIPLLDFETPKINNYEIYKKEDSTLIKKLFY